MVVALPKTAAMLAAGSYDVAMLHELWDAGEQGLTFFLAGPRGAGARALLSDGARLVWTVEAASHLDAMTAYSTFNGRGRYVSDYPDIDSQTSRPGDRSSTERQFGRDAAGVLAGASVTPQVSDAACAGLPLCAGRRPRSGTLLVCTTEQGRQSTPGIGGSLSLKPSAGQLRVRGDACLEGRVGS